MNYEREKKERKEKNPKLCKYYVKNGRCRDGDACRFNHIDNVCADYFLNGICQDENCKKDHSFTVKTVKQRERSETDRKERPHRNKKRNTESFTPSDKPSDMNVRLYFPDSKYAERDVILCPKLFEDVQGEVDIYTELLKEVNTENDPEKLWKLWHGDSHYIADDKLRFKEKSPLFTTIIDRIASHFKMDVKATRLNWYSDEKEWKPYHFDAAAVDEKKAKTQNFTIGVSFGDTREVSFQHDKTRATVNFQLEDGMTYGFGSQVNVEWRHGIPLVKPGDFKKGRISIIAWGWVDM